MMPEPTASPPPRRRRYRPPVGVPVPRQSRVASVFASLVLHALILFLVLGPILVHDALVAAEGAGGRGPTGGGGGGRNASGGLVKESVRFLQVKPPPAPKPAETPLVPPPEVRKPEPEPPKPLPPLPPLPPLEPPKDASQATGTGGGTGRDGGAGTGPGTGGGAGSGEGTGRGSGRGPGTGGGEGRIYPPTVTNLAILPIPVPAKVKPYKLTACFEVDETGKARLISWNPSKDGDYNRRIKAMLDEVRFRPAVRWDGTPVKVTDCALTAEAPL